MSYLLYKQLQNATRKIEELENKLRLKEEEVRSSLLTTFPADLSQQVTKAVASGDHHTLCLPVSPPLSA